MLTHTFTVKRDQSATEHTVNVTVPTWDEATEEQRQAVYGRFLNVSSATVYAQSVLRRALGNGTKPSELSAKAQDAFDALLAGRTVERTTITIDAAALKLDYFQAMGLKASGATVLNMPPEPKQKK